MDKNKVKNAHDEELQNIKRQLAEMREELNKLKPLAKHYEKLWVVKN